MAEGLVLVWRPGGRAQGFRPCVRGLGFECLGVERVSLGLAPWEDGPKTHTPPYAFTPILNKPNQIGYIQRPSSQRARLGR